MYRLRLEHVYYFVTCFDSTETKASGRVSGNEIHQISEGIHLPTFTLCFSYAKKKNKKREKNERGSVELGGKRENPGTCLEEDERFGRSGSPGVFARSHLNALARQNAVQHPIPVAGINEEVG